MTNIPIVARMIPIRMTPRSARVWLASQPYEIQDHQSRASTMSACRTPNPV